VTAQGAAAQAEAARQALACLDLTSLNDDDDAARIERLCARALSRHGAVAAVCVWPRFVAQARSLLPASVRVCAVANFPAGALDASLALRDTQSVLDAGGDEVDLVLPWRALLQGQVLQAAQLVAQVRRACAGRTLKLIVESGALPDEAALLAACALGLGEGVDFLKTSTGKTAQGATPEAARRMCAAIAAHARHDQVGFKASGGVRSVADAAVYLEIVRQQLGAAALQPARLRLGASALLDDIERVLDGGAAPQAGAGGAY
jgi:deoxyribose-phosphate aldolase